MAGVPRREPIAALELSPEPLARTGGRLLGQLLAERNPAGHWRGELSASALSTATASFALALWEREGGPAAGTGHGALVAGGLRWLARHANPDGGWGDTPRSRSNLSTTLLGWAALSLAPPGDEELLEAGRAAEAWLARRAGGLDPERLARALEAVYAEDRTFSVPILAMAALAGRLGEPRRAWGLVPQLPFELAALPRSSFRFLGLPVVSYALPALVALGRLRHHRRPARSPFVRLLRRGLGGRALSVLAAIQPRNGGFLEATPLTAFVAMSLLASGAARHAVTRRCVEFLAASVRADGSWPIDTDLATWVTTLSVHALTEMPGGLDRLGPEGRRALREWLLGQQYREVHPYTGAAPGGWGWTDLPGGVPDADDTAGALLALRRLGGGEESVAAGARWLLDLQNRDGGMPTFSRGWGKLPFDRSGADLTAHALRAFAAWRDDLPGLGRRLEGAIARGLGFLARAQRPGGGWAPLWFGNEEAPAAENLTYGTARVLLALGELGRRGWPVRELEERAVAWLLGAQRADGGWGGAAGVAPSVEETALAVEALARRDLLAGARGVREALVRGSEWLRERLEAPGGVEPAPLGFYFASLWYWERLYPLIFSTAALGRLQRLLSP